MVDGTTTTVNTYTYNDQNRLTGIEKKVNTVTTETTSFMYDNNGNQLVTTVTPYVDGEPGTPAVTATNTYDDLNQLTQTVAGSTTVDNTYNGEGCRIEKTVGTNVTKYLYEADKVILEVDGSNNQTGRNIYGVNLLSRTAGGATLNYLYNGHSDVTVLINTNVRSK